MNCTYIICLLKSVPDQILQVCSKTLGKSLCQTIAAMFYWNQWCDHAHHAMMISLLCYIDRIEKWNQVRSVLQIHHSFRSVADCFQRIRELWMQRGTESVPVQLHRLELVFLQAAISVELILAMSGNDFVQNTRKHFKDGYFAYDQWEQCNVHLLHLPFYPVPCSPQALPRVVIGEHKAAYVALEKSLGGRTNKFPVLSSPVVI